MRRRQKLNFHPMVLGDPHAYIITRFIAAERSNDGTILCVRVDMTNSCVSALLIDEIAVGVRFIPVEAEAVEHRAQLLKSRALALGATPEAIRLLGLVMPISKEEENTMAEKLKAKGSAKADKEGLKSAAKSAPVAKKGAAAADGEAPKKRGNAEALAKAREARNSGPDTRKIKALIKPKEIAAREGSYRHSMLTDLLGSKTVQEFRDKNAKYSAGDLRYAVGAGIVSVG